jgi:hypothetical protein
MGRQAGPHGLPNRPAGLSKAPPAGSGMTRPWPKISRPGARVARRFIGSVHSRRSSSGRSGRRSKKQASLVLPDRWAGAPTHGLAATPSEEPRHSVPLLLQIAIMKVLSSQLARPIVQRCCAAARSAPELVPELHVIRVHEHQFWRRSYETV